MSDRILIPVDGCACDALAAATTPGAGPTPAPGPIVRPAGARQCPPDGHEIYTVALPPGLSLLNANRTRKMHWTVERRIARDIRTAAMVVARNQRIPLIDRARVIYIVHPTPQTRKRDPGNWSVSAKAAVDGLVDAGVFVDDDAAHVIGPDPRLGVPVPRGQLVLLITPVGDAR